MESLSRHFEVWTSLIGGWWRSLAGTAGEALDSWSEWTARQLEPLSRIFTPWLGKLQVLLDDPFLWITALVVLLLFSNILVLLFTIIMRMVYSRRDKVRMSRHRLWNQLVPAHLAGEDNAAEIRASVSKGQERLFAEYIRPFLLDIEGDDHQRLLDLLESMNFIALLSKMLRQRSQWSRSFALHFLGLMGAAEQAGQVRPHLFEPSELVSHSAAEALMLIKDAESVPIVLRSLVSTAGNRQDRVSSLISAFGPEILPVLHKLLREDWLTGWMRVLILNAMASHVYLDAAWDILELATQTSDRDVYIACLRALAGFEDTTLLGYFEDLLTHQDPVVRAVAARALGNIGEVRHLEPLAGMLRSGNFWLLRETVSAIMAYGDMGRDVLALVDRQGDVSPLASRLIHEALPEGIPGD